LRTERTTIPAPSRQARKSEQASSPRPSRSRRTG